MLRLYFLLFFLIFVNSTTSQNFSKQEIDSKIKLIEKIRETNPNECIDKALEILAICKSNNYKEGEAMANCTIGLSYSILNKTDEAKKYLKVALSTLPSTNKNYILKGNVNSGLGYLYFLESNYSESLSYFLTALKFFDDSENTEDKYRTMYYIANLYARTKLYKESSELIDTIMKNCEYSNIRAMTMTVLASINTEMGNHKQALEHTKEIMDCCLLGMSETSKLVFYINYTYILLDNNKNDEAYKTFNTLTDLIDKSNYDFLKLNYNIVASRIYLSKKKYDKAIEKVTLAVQEAKRSNLNYEIHLALLQKATIYKDFNLQQKSINVYHEILLLKQTGDSDFLRAKALLELSETYYTVDDIKAAYKYHKEYVNFFKNSSSNEHQEQQSLLKVKFDFSKLKYNLKLNESIYKITKERASKLEQRNIFIIISTIFLTLVFILMYNRQKKINKATKKLKLANEEVYKIDNEKFKDKIKYQNDILENYLIGLEDKKNTLNEFKAIINQYRDGEINNKTLIFNLTYTINNKTEAAANDDSIYYNESKERTEKYFIRLNDKHKDITNVEKKIILCIKNGLKSKQIGSKLNINDRSVNNYRSSIRKKVNLNRNDNLEDYLNTI